MSYEVTTYVSRATPPGDASACYHALIEELDDHDCSTYDRCWTEFLDPAIVHDWQFHFGVRPPFAWAGAA